MFDPITAYLFWCLMNILSFSCYVSLLSVIDAGFACLAFKDSYIFTPRFSLIFNNK